MSQARNQKLQRQRTLVLVRYAAPIAVVILTVISLFLPCLRYTTAESGTGEVISTAELLRNSWDQVRAYLFGGGTKNAPTELFSQVVLTVLCADVLLFCIGAAAAIWSGVGALCFFRTQRDEGTARALYLTVFPGPAAILCWEAAMLPLLAFPRILVLCYKNLLYTSVMLQVTFAEPMIIGGILLLLMAALTVLSASVERRCGMSPFRLKQKRADRLARRQSEEAEAEAEEETAPTFETEADRQYYEMVQRAKAEQAEKIRALLQRREDSSEDEDHRE